MGYDAPGYAVEVKLTPAYILNKRVPLKDVFEYLDDGTKKHQARVASAAERVAGCLGPEYGSKEIVEIASRYHDVGKVAFKELVTNGRELNDEERKIMTFHPIYSGLILIGNLSEFPYDEDIIVRPVVQHHENLDGSGYPFGLKGNDICPAARIIRVCDSFDAGMKRKYNGKKGPMERLRQELIEDSKKKYDPEVVRAFEKAVLEDETFLIRTYPGQE